MTPVQFAASGAVPTSMKENSTTRESSNTEIDQSTIDAMVRLEIEDIIETANNSNDRQSQERCEDSHLALELYIQELLYANGILNDQKSADTLALEQVVAIQSGSIVSQIKEEEDQDGTEAPQLPKYSEELNYSRYTTGSSWKNASRSHQADLSDFRRDLETSLPRICVSCIEEKAASEFFTVPCLHQHEFCRDCLARMFEILLAEEASFPPQCDGVDIPFPDAYFSLPADLNERIVSKLPELLATSKSYCYDPQCGAFIPEDARHKRYGVGRCTMCNKTTCIMCKGSSHKGECPVNRALKQLMNTAKEKKNCNSVKHVTILYRLPQVATI